MNLFPVSTRRRLLLAESIVHLDGKIFNGMPVLQCSHPGFQARCAAQTLVTGRLNGRTRHEIDSRVPAPSKGGLGAFTGNRGLEPEGAHVWSTRHMSSNAHCLQISTPNRSGEADSLLSAGCTDP